MQDDQRLAIAQRIAIDPHIELEGTFTNSDRLKVSHRRHTYNKTDMSRSPLVACETIRPASPLKAIADNLLVCRQGAKHQFVRVPDFRSGIRV